MSFEEEEEEGSSEREGLGREAAQRGRIFCDGWRGVGCFVGWRISCEGLGDISWTSFD